MTLKRAAPSAAGPSTNVPRSAGPRGRSVAITAASRAGSGRSPNARIPAMPHTLAFPQHGDAVTVHVVDHVDGFDREPRARSELADPSFVGVQPAAEPHVAQHADERPRCEAKGDGAEPPFERARNRRRLGMHRGEGKRT